MNDGNERCSRPLRSIAINWEVYFIDRSAPLDFGNDIADPKMELAI